MRGIVCAFVLVLAPAFASLAAGDDVVTASDTGAASRCRFSDVGWDAWACDVDVAVTLAVPRDCPDDVCSFSIETLATAQVEHPGPYELNTFLRAGQAGAQGQVCVGLNKEQNDYFAREYPDMFPCVQSCRVNGIGTQATCHGTLTGTIAVPEGECGLIGTDTSFGYYNSGTLTWVDFWVCRGEGTAMWVFPAVWND